MRFDPTYGRARLRAIEADLAEGRQLRPEDARWLVRVAWAARRLYLRSWKEWAPDGEVAEYMHTGAAIENLARCLRSLA